MDGKITTLEQLLRVLDEFYNHAGSQNTELSRLLVEYRRTPLAWQHCEQILQNTTLDVAILHWAASTMQYKLVNDFRDVPPASYIALRDSLMTKALALDQVPNRQSAMRALASAVAALVIQLPPEVWPDPVMDLVRLPEAHLEVVLTVLQRVPDDLNSKRVRVAQARHLQCTEYLNSKTDTVLDYVQAVLARVPAHANSALRCFNSWLRSCTVDKSQLEQRPLVAAVYDALAQPALADAAADCVVNIIRRVCDRPEAPLARLVLDRVAVLGGLYQRAVEQSDAATRLAVSRVFAEVGESFAAHLLRCPQEAALLAQVLLHAASFAAYDGDNLALDFFHALAREVVLSMPEDRAVLAQPLVPVYQQLAALVLRKMALPDDYDDMTADEREEVNEFRHKELAPTLRDCSAVMGVGALMALVHAELEAQCQRCAADAQQWRGVEAAFFAVRVLGRCVDRADDVPALPAILERLLQAPPMRHMQYTAILVMGRYADWLRRRPAILAPVIQYVTNALADPHARQNAAALSFQHICTACAASLAPQIDQIIGFYERCAPLLTTTDSDECLKGIARVVSTLPHDRALAALQHMCSAPAATLQALVPQLQRLPPAQTTPQSADVAALVKQSVDAFHTMGSLLRHVNMETTAATTTTTAAAASAAPGAVHPVLSLMGTLWPAIAAPLFVAFDALPDEVAYELCRFCRCAVTSCESGAAPMLEALLQAATHAYARRPYPDLLYLTNELLRVFGTDHQHTATLTAAVQALCQATFSALQTPDACSWHPTIVHEFFGMLVRWVERLAPAILVAQSQPLQLATACVAYAVHLLPTAHNCLEGTRSSLVFVTRLLKAGKQLQRAAAVDALLAQTGYPLVHALLCCIGGRQPVSLYADIRSVLTTLHRLNAPALLTWLCFALSVPLPPDNAPVLMPAGLAQPYPLPFAVDAGAAQVFIQELFTATRESQALGAVELFGNECRRAWRSPDPIC